MWKVLEGLGSSWKVLEVVGRVMKVMEALSALSKNREASWKSPRENPLLGKGPVLVVSEQGLVQRVRGVETSMAELKNQVEGLEGLDSNFASMREDFREALNTLSGDLKRELHDLRDSFMGEITKIREEFGEEVSTLHQTIENLQADVAGVVCKARAVDDFLWEMEQYLEGVNMVDDTFKIKMATRYLKDTAALWWRRRYGDIERGTATIDTWAEFVADFKKQFYPENAKNEAKSRLRKLKQSGTIREYVKEFTTLTELERRGVQDLSTAIAQAEALIDFSTRRDSSKPKDKKVNQEKGGGDKNAQLKVDAARKPPTEKDKNLKTSYKNGGCFICDGPHRAREEKRYRRIVEKAYSMLKTTINGVVKTVEKLAGKRHGGFKQSDMVPNGVSEQGYLMSSGCDAQGVAQELTHIRRDVDHTSEVRDGFQPPAKSPYRMPPPELEELRKLLKELMDAGYIRPSKAPYG
ncbi:putative retrotransposon gag domain, aspartic peptidase domain protein [Tanacetum coccineum]